MVSSWSYTTAKLNPAGLLQVRDVAPSSGETTDGKEAMHVPLKREGQGAANTWGVGLPSMVPLMQTEPCRSRVPLLPISSVTAQVVDPSVDFP